MNSAKLVAGGKRGPAFEATELDKLLGLIGQRFDGESLRTERQTTDLGEAELLSAMLGGAL